MKIGYAVSTLILLGVMLATLVAQLKARKFSPALYWTVIATTSMAGTTISDYMDRTLKFGYYKGSAILVALLVAALVFWRAWFGSLSIARVTRFSMELMFWTTVLIANTLGTALGDWMSDNTGLGFGRATLVMDEEPVDRREWLPHLLRVGRPAGDPGRLRPDVQLRGHRLRPADPRRRRGDGSRRRLTAKGGGDAQPSAATATMGWAGGWPPREPTNGELEKSKMPPSAATIR
jgi:hypothetical protein